MQYPQSTIALYLGFRHSVLDAPSPFAPFAALKPYLPHLWGIIPCVHVVSMGRGIMGSSHAIIFAGGSGSLPLQIIEVQ